MLICAISLDLSAQNSLTIAETNLDKGNLNGLSKILYNSVDITFTNQSKTYSKAQAEIILKKFFSKNEPTSFKIKYKGESMSNNTLYAIGDLVSRNAVFKVYLFFIPGSGDKYLLREIRFEKN